MQLIKVQFLNKPNRDHKLRTFLCASKELKQSKYKLDVKLFF